MNYLMDIKNGTRMTQISLKTRIFTDLSVATANRENPRWNIRLIRVLMFPPNFL
ncbi:hypothetical protein [Runella sp.]|uniref:hypothetical protein n=1 Tax=Runella sp. TaxID=1960881 RepID=UPI003016721C